MIRQEQLSQWLGDRQRKYADGLVLFNALAKEAMKKKFAAYLAAAPEDLNPEKPDVPLNKNDAFQKVQKRRVQEKR